jgi:hypothetical protein
LAGKEQTTQQSLGLDGPEYPFPQSDFWHIGPQNDFLNSAQIADPATRFSFPATIAAHGQPAIYAC